MLDVDGGGTLTQDEFLEGGLAITSHWLFTTALDFSQKHLRCLGSRLVCWPHGERAPLDRECGRKGMGPTECGRHGNGGKWMGRLVSRWKEMGANGLWDLLVGMKEWKDGGCGREGVGRVWGKKTRRWGAVGMRESGLTAVVLLLGSAFGLFSRYVLEPWEGFGASGCWKLPERDTPTWQCVTLAYVMSVVKFFGFIHTVSYGISTCTLQFALYTYVLIRPSSCCCARKNGRARFVEPSAVGCADVGHTVAEANVATLQAGDLPANPMNRFVEGGANSGWDPWKRDNSTFGAQCSAVLHPNEYGVVH